MKEFDEGICHNCEENCCRNFYVVLEDVTDRDWITWLSYHQGVTIKKQQGKRIEVWFDYPCTHLNEDGACAIYQKRPKICRRFTCEKMEKLHQAENNEAVSGKKMWWPIFGKKK